MISLPYSESEIREFFEKHQHDNPADVLLSRSDLEREKLLWLLEQLKSRNRLRTKIPEWYNRFDLILPPEGNLSQSSSTLTAQHKSKWVIGDLLDLTGGSGVDLWQMSSNGQRCKLVEPNSELLAITQYNLTRLHIDVETHQGDAESYLDALSPFEGTIYLDPSRRSDDGSKTVALHRMSPDLTGMWSALLEKSKRIIVKLSPLFDLTAIQRELSNVMRIEVVAVNNEVKEVLVIAEPKFEGRVQIEAIELNPDRPWSYSSEADSRELNRTFGEYIYDPSSALVKAELSDAWAAENELSRPYPQAHVYFSDTLKENYPGRVFRITQKDKPYKLKDLPQRLSIISRYYHERPEQIRKKLKVGESETDFLFALGKNKGERVFIHAVRVV
ncbi:MAG: hypothetical protein HWD92_03510 [Flavobacteriia bacterium]|nr:hypothetical protein [Flavobacteriia bacterium]